MYLWTAFLVGLAGSLHCIGMCGPIVIALPSSQQSRTHLIRGRISYNLGRVFTYSLMGLLFGLFGKGIAMAGFQRDLSIVLGVVILLFMLFPYRYRSFIGRIPAVAAYSEKVRSAFFRIAEKPSYAQMFLLGLINGLLPCGLVYVAVAGAVTAGAALDGMLFMALFGLGTVPLMLTASIFGRFINAELRRKFNRFMPYLAVLLALIFILRGLNLGIPYVSPRLAVKSHTVSNEPAKPQILEQDCCK